MSHRVLTAVATALLTAGVTAGPANAQHTHQASGHAGGHVSGGHVGGGHVVAPHATFVRPNNRFYYGGHAYYHPGYAHYGYRYPYYRNGIGFGLGYPFYYGGYGFNYPYSYGYSYPDYTLPDAIAPQPSTSAYPPAEAAPAPMTSGVARMTVQLPADAKLWIDGQATTQTGSARLFETPAVLDPGREYSYRLKAEWVENGQPVTRERVVTFRAGNQVVVNLTVS